MAHGFAGEQVLPDQLTQETGLGQMGKTPEEGVDHFVFLRVVGKLHLRPELDHGRQTEQKAQPGQDRHRQQEDPAQPELIAEIKHQASAQDAEIHEPAAGHRSLGGATLPRIMVSREAAE